MKYIEIGLAYSLLILEGMKRTCLSFLALALVVGVYGSATLGCGGGANSSGKSAPNPNARAQKGVVHYIGDHLGSAHLITDSKGNVLREESRYPYGLDWRADGTDTITADYVYTGKEYDEETGLVYFGGRYYSPEMGRWITPDPKYLENPKELVEKSNEMNLYAYVINNPINYFDKEGLDVFYFGANLSGWIASKPMEETNQAAGGVVEYGYAVNVKNLSMEKMFQADNYEITNYATKGFVDNDYEKSSGFNFGLVLNMGYLGKDTALDDFQGHAVEYVGAIADFGLTETVLDNDVHGTAASVGAGFGLGGTTYETETKIDIDGVSEFRKFVFGSETSNETSKIIEP